MAVPSNISKGTYVHDGIRSGPFPTRQITTQPDNNGVLTSGNWDRYGPGILYSPQNTWDIVPYSAVVGDIVPVTTPGVPAAAGYLTLATGAGPAATSALGANGQTYVQFDWPRVVSVTISAANLAGPVNVTVFGTDWYGFPLQHTYTVQNTGTYPNAVSGLATPAKAFYTVTGIYFNGSAGTSSVTVQTTNTFGLPYVVTEYSDIMNFSWNGNNMKDQYGTTAAMTAGAITITTPAVVAASNIQLTARLVGGTQGILALSAAPTARTSFPIVSSSNLDTSTVFWSIADGAQNLFAYADTTSPSTGITGDVRGLFKLPEVGQSWAGVPDGVKRAIVTPYIFGADMFQNQLASAGQSQGGSTVPFLTAAKLYGQAQYYTGIPG